MKNIKFIYFDCGGVLFSFQNGFKKIAEMTDRKLENVIRVFKKYDDLTCRGELTPQNLWNKYREELDVKKFQDFDFIDFWTKNFVPIKEAHKLLKHLIKNYPVGLLTNIYNDVFESALRKNSISKLDYAVIVQSCNIGFVKPEREIYEYAQKIIDVSSENIFFVDDKKECIEKAEKLGWKGFVFQEFNPQKSVNSINSFLKDR